MSSLEEVVKTISPIAIMAFVTSSSVAARLVSQAVEFNEAVIKETEQAEYLGLTVEEYRMVMAIPHLIDWDKLLRPHKRDAAAKDE